MGLKSDSASALQEIKYVSNTDRGKLFKAENEDKIKPDTLFLYFTIFTGLLPQVVGGANVVWLSSAYPSLVSNNSDINPLDKPATTTDISMITGIPPMIGLIGPLFLTKIADTIGRKYFLQISALGLFFCNIGQTFATLTIQLTIIRCLLGIFLGSYTVILQVYISEISENHNRAKYLCLMAVCYPIGNIYAFYCGPIFTYRLFTGILVIPMLPFLLFFFIAPESPVYLISKEKKLSCLNSLKKLRSNKTISEIKLDLDKLNQNLKQTHNDKNMLHLFKTKEARTATTLAFLLAVAPHISGMCAIMSYLGPLLLEADTTLSENTMTVTVSVIQTVSILSTSFLVVKISRRKLLILSCTGCGLSCLIWGFFYYLKSNNNPLTSILSFLPLFSIICYTLMFSVGLGPIPMALISEIFPCDLVSAAVSFSICVIGVVVSLIMSSYPLIAFNFGLHWCVWMFSFGSFVIGVVIYCFLPETRGKDVGEVMESFRGIKM